VKGETMSDEEEKETALPLDLSKCGSMEGRVGAILCWNSDEGDATEMRQLARIVRQLRKIVRHKFDGLSEDDLFCLWDAIGSYSSRNEQLESLYRAVDQAWVRTSRNNADTQEE
jgi:hypothetical protein